MMLSLLCGVLLLLFQACNSAEHSAIIASFPKAAQLHATVKKVPVPFLLPRFMGITGDRLLIYKDKEDCSSFLHCPNVNM